MDRSIQLLHRDIGFCPVKDSSFIGTCGDAVPATDAPVVIDHHQSIWFFPGSMDRAYLHTRGVLAVLALNRQIDEAFLRN
jgi:hypothetical protein